MPIMREPKPLPSPLDYIPPDSIEYFVTGQESWDKLAQRPDMKSANVSSADLCYFNFKTRIPAEVNWYLYHKVGCRHATTNQLNYQFNIADDPGVVYLPKFAAAIPVHEKQADPEPERIDADQVMIYASGESAFATLAEKFEKENPGKNKSEVADKADEVATILNRYQNLKQLNIYTHGNVGYVYFPNGGINKYNLETLAAPHDKLFQGEGRVLFVGCDIGDGKDGRNFLIAAGRRLLKDHGGFVGATTATNFFGRWGLFDFRMPKWGDLRVIRLDSDGNILQEQNF